MNMDFAALSQMAKTAASQAKTAALKAAQQAQERLEDTEGNRQMMQQFAQKVGRTLDEFIDEAPGDLTKITDLTYVTDRFVAMGFPASRRGAPGSAAARACANPIGAVAKHLKTYHDGHFMVLNVSEETYDYRRFEDNVLEFKFPGHPAPPLGMLVKICTTLESWLDADHENVAAVHCLTGRGRTSVVVACVLAWLGEFEANPIVALKHVAERRKDDVERLTIPSQRRYVGYFANILDGCAPRHEPLILKRAIMHTIPNFGSAETPGCRPYLQFFRGGKLAHTASWQGSENTWAAPSEGSLVFPVDVVVHGDLLVRCRHVDDRERRTSMFRAALHVGFAPTGVLRLTRDQLDGACGDDRFDGDFFIDLIFEPASGAQVQALSAGVASHEGGFSEAYDALLAKDSTFWKDVEDRKVRARARRASKPARTANARAAQAAAAAPEPMRRAPSPKTAVKQGSIFEIGDSPLQTRAPVPDLLDTDDLVRQLADADALFGGGAEEVSLLELQQLADAPPMADEFAAFAATPAPPAPEFAAFEGAPAPAAPEFAAFEAAPASPAAPPPAPALAQTPSKDPFGAFEAVAAPPPAPAPPRPPSPGRRDTTDILADLEAVLGDAPPSAPAAPAADGAAFDVDDFESFLDGLDGGGK